MSIHHKSFTANSYDISIKTSPVSLSPDSELYYDIMKVLSDVINRINIDLSYVVHEKLKDCEAWSELLMTELGSPIKVMAIFDQYSISTDKLMICFGINITLEIIKEYEQRHVTKLMSLLDEDEDKLS